LELANIPRKGSIVETAKEARQGERGPSMLVVLAVSIGLVAIVFLALWYGFITN
jgi:hypothetical protein